jgi:hypothetical protein
MTGFERFDTAVKIRDLVRKITEAKVEELRPRLQYATVTAIDIVKRQASVLFPGETTEAKVTFGSIVPATVGQVVRVEGVPGDRFIADVMGSDARARVYIQTFAPPGLTINDKGDLWIDTSTDARIISVWNGSAWQNLELASQEYVISRGNDLVTNGLGTLGTNYNFSGWTFSISIAPTGVAGAFASTAGVTQTLSTDEYMAVDPSKKMRFAFKAIQLQSVAGGGYMYAGIQPFDAYKLSISPAYVMFTANTLTTLAAQLNPGDTTITLASSANWYGVAGKAAGSSVHLRSIIWWDYVDQGGKAWPENTYSRNYSGTNYYADGAIVGNVITLNAPYVGPVRPVGTKLSNGSSGGTYMYGGAVNSIIPTTWTDYSATITGFSSAGASPSMATGWPAGVGYARLIWLTNRTGAGGSDATSKHAIAGISFSDVSAASADLAAYQQAVSGPGGLLDGKSEIYYSATDPNAGATFNQYDNGNMWVNTTTGIVKVFVWATGPGTWQDVTNQQAIDAANAADDAQQAADSIDAINLNPSFSVWAGAPGTAPNNWTTFTTAPTKETILYRTPPYSVRFNCTDATTQRGIYTSGASFPMAIGLQYVTMTVDVMLNGGTSFGGSGVLLDWTGMTGGNRATVNLSAEIPAPTTGKWYRVTKVLQRPATAVGTQTSWISYLMGQYPSGMGAMAIKDVIFNRFALRPSTTEEVAAYLAAPQATVTALTNTVNTKITTFYTGTVPVAAAIGDLWVNTADNNKLYRAASVGADAIAAGEWVEVTDTRIAASAATLVSVQGTLTGLQGQVDGKSTVYVQGTQPHDSNLSSDIGDIWIDTSAGRIIRTYDGANWNASDDLRLATALATANGKITTFYSALAAVPVSTAIGDLWVPTDASNKIYRAASIGADAIAAGEWIEIASNAPRIISLSGNSKMFKDVLAWTQAAPDLVGNFVIHTPITAGNYMFNMRISGYNYFAPYTDIELKVAGYFTSTPAFANIGVTKLGSTPIQVRLAREVATGTVAIILTPQSPIANFDYPKITIPEAIIGHTNPPDTFLNGWSLSVITEATLTNVANYTLLSTPPVQDAQSAASTAIAAAATAQATADGKVTTYYAATAPATHDPGDLWVDSDDKQLYRWSGSAWVSIQDSGIAEALSDASNAQATADGKIVSFYQTTAPTATSVGDLWIDTDDGNKLYRWSGSAWITVQDAAIAAAQASASTAIANASAAQTTANSKVTTYYQAAAPATHATGDLWIDSDDKKLYRWNGSVWVDSQDTSIGMALSNAANAQATADGKIVTFYQTAAPTATSVGDLWVDTDDGNRLYRWSGSAWVTIRDTTIATAQTTANNALTAANGKNKVTFSTSAPGTTANTLGDIWFQKDAGNFIIGQWLGTGGTSWQSTALSSAVIASIDAGVITVGTLSGITITAVTFQTGLTGNRWRTAGGGTDVGQWQAYYSTDPNFGGLWIEQNEEFSPSLSMVSPGGGSGAAVVRVSSDYNSLGTRIDLDGDRVFANSKEIPLGRVGKGARSTTSGTTTTAELTVLSTGSIDFKAGRSYKIDLLVSLQSTVATDRVALKVYVNGVATTCLANMQMGVASVSFTQSLAFPYDPPSDVSGIVEVKIFRSAGSGNVSCFASAGQNSTVTVVDEGVF